MAPIPTGHHDDIARKVYANNLNSIESVHYGYSIYLYASYIPFAL